MTEVSPAAASSAAPLPEAPRRYKVAVRISKTPRQSRGRVFVRTDTAVDIFGPAGALLRVLKFNEDENVTRENVLENSRVLNVLRDFGVRAADVELAD